MDARFSSWIPLWHSLQPSDCNVDVGPNGIFLTVLIPKRQEIVKNVFVSGISILIFGGLFAAGGDLPVRTCLALFVFAAAMLTLASVQLTVCVDKCSVQKQTRLPIGFTWSRNFHLLPPIRFSSRAMKSDDQHSIEIGVIDGNDQFISIISFDRSITTDAECNDLCRKLEKQLECSPRTGRE